MKKKHEDVFSMIRGLRLWKGNIHISFGTPLTDRAYTSAEEVAAHLKETFPTIRQVFGALRTTTSAR